MYIFVHRGDAVSGHYWGYGRNDNKWYRFDINTSPIEQGQIVIDMEKSAATPYALLYVKEAHLPHFDYSLHLDNAILSHKYPNDDFRACYEPKLASEVIQENQELHQKNITKQNQNIKSKTFHEYVSRLTQLKKVANKHK